MTNETIVKLNEILYPADREAKKRIMTKKLLEELRNNEEALQYLDQELERWYRLSRNCCSRDSVYEETIKLAVERAKTYEACMKLVPSQTKDRRTFSTLVFPPTIPEELCLLILSKAATFAKGSKQYLNIANLHVGTELEVEMVVKSLGTAEVLEECFNIFNYFPYSKIDYDVAGKLITYLIKKTFSLVEDFEEVDKIYGLLTSSNRGQYSPLMREEFKIMAIREATESKVNFIHKQDLKTIVGINAPEANHLALEIMSFTIQIEKLKRAPEYIKFLPVLENLDQNII